MLKHKIKEDLTFAIKGGDETVRSTLRLLLSAILSKEKEKKYKEGVEDLTDEEVLAVIVSEAKKRRESAIEYEKGKRPELAEKEKQELVILQRYLPEQISEEELRKLVKEAVAKTGASGPKDIGRVMSELMPGLRGRADGNLVGKIVKELLS